MSGFKRLSQITEKLVKKEPNKAFRKVILGAHQVMTSGSPVDTGNFRANWRGSVGSPDTSYREIKHHARSHLTKGAPLTPLERNNIEPALKAEIGDTAYISNETPYGPDLEGGHSPQAPAGVLHVGVARIKAKLQGIVK
jgi:hypothetical protein